jgi:hypothetical protein
MAIKLCLVGMLATSALAGATPASAGWTTNGSSTGLGTDFSGTAASSVFTVVTTGAGAQGIRCNTLSAAGHWHGSGVILPDGTRVATTTSFGFSACTEVGQNAAVRCDVTNMNQNAVSFSPATSVTLGTLTGVSCSVTKSACGNSTSVTGGITVTGSVNDTYGNTSQQLSINTTGQSLSVSWTAAGCLSGTSPGSGTFTNSSGTALSASVTSAFKPQITN